MFPATLTTDRLTLRPAQRGDAEAIFDRYASDPFATKYLSWPTHTSLDDTHAFLNTILAPPPASRDQHWVIVPQDDAVASGMITTFGVGQVVALGYVLSRPLWGRGLVTEALRAVAAQVWQDPRTWRLQALAHVENVGSQRVLEKGGLRREGVLRRRFVMPQISDEPQDCVLYAQVRDDLG